jgi:transcriptional regulator GlxA family with amidase domain
MFRKHTRISVVDYLIRLRVGRACSLLLEETMPVSTVAAQVGYTNISLFNRQFTRLKGKAPSEFRREHTQLRDLATPTRLSMDRWPLAGRVHQ